MRQQHGKGVSPEPGGEHLIRHGAAQPLTRTHDDSITPHLAQCVVHRGQQSKLDHDHGARCRVPAQYLGHGLPETEPITQVGEAVVVRVITKLGE